MGTYDRIIWDFLVSKGFTEIAAAGIMGNLYAESGLQPTNLQNSYERTLGLNDAQYTAAVDNGTYANFVHDSAGYGLAQWTYWSRKEKLLTYAQSRGASIGDINAQLDFLFIELQTYSGIIARLNAAGTVRDASDIILLEYERPADQSESTRIKRAEYGETYYNLYTKNATQAPAQTKPQAAAGFLTDKVAGIQINCDYRADSSNYNSFSARNTLYGVVHYTGNEKDTAKANAQYFAGKNREASAHFFVDEKSIYQSVAINNTAWHCGAHTYRHAECRNDNSIGVEMCCSGGFLVSEKTNENAAQLFAYLYKKGLIGNPDKYLVRHYDVTGKSCPAQMASENNDEWARFKLRVKEVINGDAGTGTGAQQQQGQQVTTQAPAQTFNAAGTAKTTANLRLRTGAGTSYNTLVVVNKGATVEIDGTTANGWYRCKYGDLIGYMSGSYLKNIETTTSTQTAQRTHIVQRGDTLTYIARKYGTTVNAIVIANRKKYPKMTANYIMIGWELIV